MDEKLQPQALTARKLWARLRLNSSFRTKTLSLQILSLCNFSYYHSVKTVLSCARSCIWIPTVNMCSVKKKFWKKKWKHKQESKYKISMLIKDTSLKTFVNSVVSQPPCNIWLAKWYQENLWLASPAMTDNTVCDAS